MIDSCNDPYLLCIKDATIKKYFGDALSLTIPNNILNIDAEAFVGSNLTNVIFENPNNWYVGDTIGATTTLLSASDLSNPEIAASYLTNDYNDKYWTQY